MKRSLLNCLVVVTCFVCTIYLVACIQSVSPQLTGTAVLPVSPTPSTSTLKTIITPTKTTEPTVSPTLAAEEALTFIKQMQRINGECRLPCWWGITPGITTLDEARQVFAPLRHYRTTRGTVGFSYPDYSGIDASIETENGIVKEIWVFASTFRIDKGNNIEYLPFDESWYPYSLRGVLEQLGPPSKAQIGFGTVIDAVGNEYFDQYELHVFYNDAGLIVRYTGLPDETETGNVRACFALSQAVDIRVYIREPVISSDGLQVPPWDYLTNPKSLEEATHLSLVEFYENFQGDQDCLDSPSSLWLNLHE